MLISTFQNIVENRVPARENRTVLIRNYLLSPSENRQYPPLESLKKKLLRFLKKTLD